MKSKELLSQLSELENKLNSFSFDELTSSEASSLQRTFNSFKNSLEEKVYVKNSSQASTTEEFDKEIKFSKLSLESLETPKVGFKKDWFVKALSKEIYTPLNTVMHLATELQNKDAEKFQQLQAIKDTSLNLLDVVSELSDYTLSSNESLEKVEFKISDILRNVLFVCKTLVVDHSVSVDIAVDVKIPKIIVGDASKLTQVLLNLVGDAIKSMDVGHVVLKIFTKNISGKAIDIGFSITKNETVTKPVLNSHNNLGLIVTKRIIEIMKGEITSTDNVNKFSIPFESSANIETNQGVNKSISGGNPEELIAGMSVLVFEDNPLNQKIIDVNLKRYKCKTYITDNAMFGLKILENNEIDIVLMDLRMPGMDGYQVTQLIRENKYNHVNQVPIIALTADFSIQDRDDCQEKGINDYLLKPYTAEELLEKLVENIINAKSLTKGETIEDNEAKYADDDEVVNLQPILEECMGEIDLLEELVNLYKSNALEFIGKAKVHIKDMDYRSLEFAAHKMKAGLAMMKTFGLRSIIVAMHTACTTEKDMKHAAFLYDCFLNEYPIIEEAIDAELEKIKSNR